MTDPIPVVPPAAPAAPPPPRPFLGLDAERRHILYAVLGAILVFAVGAAVRPGFASPASISAVLLVASFGYGAQALRARAQGGGSSAPSGPRPARSGGLRSRMEDRLRRRFDEN